MTATWDQWHKSGHGDLIPQPLNYTSTVVVSLTAAANGVGLALSHTSLFGAPERAGQLVRPFDGELKMQERYIISEPGAQDQTPAALAFLDWMEDIIIRVSGVQILPPQPIITNNIN